MRTFLIALLIGEFFFPRSKAFGQRTVELQRPPGATEELDISLERLPAVGDKTKYLVHFDNRTDREVTFTDLKVRFPDLKFQPRLITGEDARRYEEEARQNFSGHKPYSSGAAGQNTFIRTHVPRISGSNCEAACVVMIVVLVVLFVGLIAIAIKESSAKALASETLEDQQKPDLGARPLQILRFQKETRQVIIQNQTNYDIGTIEIEMKDNQGRTRIFRTRDARPST